MRDRQDPCLVFVWCSSLSIGLPVPKSFWPREVLVFKAEQLGEGDIQSSLLSWNYVSWFFIHSPTLLHLTWRFWRTKFLHLVFLSAYVKIAASADYSWHCTEGVNSQYLWKHSCHICVYFCVRTMLTVRTSVLLQDVPLSVMVWLHIECLFVPQSFIHCCSLAFYGYKLRAYLYHRGIGCVCMKPSYLHISLLCSVY